MVFVGFGKRQRFAHKARQSLPQGIVPTFHMSGLTRLFTDRLMLACQVAKNDLVRFPKIAKGGTMAIRVRYPMPQSPATFFTAVANKIGNDLSRATTKRNPNPPFVLFMAHK